jgi:amino acid transporter
MPLPTTVHLVPQQAVAAIRALGFFAVAASPPQLVVPTPPGSKTHRGLFALLAVFSVLVALAALAFARISKRRRRAR